MTGLKQPWLRWMPLWLPVVLWLVVLWPLYVLTDWAGVVWPPHTLEVSGLALVSCRLPMMLVAGSRGLLVGRSPHLGVAGGLAGVMLRPALILALGRWLALKGLPLISVGQGPPPRAFFWVWVLLFYWISLLCEVSLLWTHPYKPPNDALLPDNLSKESTND